MKNDVIDEANKISEIIKNAKTLKEKADETLKNGQEIKENLIYKLNQLKSLVS